MYIPASFAETDQGKLHGFIEANSFGLLVSTHQGEPFATHLPFLLERASGPHGTLVGHMATPSPFRPSRGVLMLSIPERYARRTGARKLALELMARHGLHDWRFGFNRRKRSMGLCRFESRTIELSMYFVDGNSEDEIRDTILHEIAHALVGPRHGHDRVWKRKCLEIGATPQRCGQADMPSGRWQARCGGGGRQFHRHRRPKRLTGWHCGSCGPEQGKLTWRMAGATMP